jgi:uncharacterized protein YutE (UPF0331/DUF86 family)
MPVDRDVVESRIRDAVEAINELKRITSKSFNEMSIDEIYSMRYNIIVLVEALASICIHIAIEHFGLKPRSYTECFRGVSQRLGIACYRDLEALARLRNLLVHRYWAIRDDIVYSNVKTNFRCVNEFIESVRRLIGT